MTNVNFKVLLGGVSAAIILGTSACTINVPSPDMAGNYYPGGPHPADRYHEAPPPSDVIRVTPPPSLEVHPDSLRYQPQPAPPKKLGMAEKFRLFGPRNTDAQNRAIMGSRNQAPRSTADMTREEIRNRSTVTSRRTGESTRRLKNERIVPQNRPVKASKPWEVLLGKPPFLPDL